MTPELVTTGGLTIDHVIAADGTVRLACTGGNGAYSSVGALCWATTVGLVSVAVSSYPRAALEALRRNGILLDGVVQVPAELESGNWFIYDAEGNRQERLCSRPEELAEAGFSTERLSPEEIARWQAMLRARHVPGELSYSQFRDTYPIVPAQVPAAYLDARGVHLAPSRPVVLNALLPLFNARGMVVTLDPGWQLAELSLAEIEPLLAQVDAFLPSEIELRAILPGLAPEAALAVLAARCRGTAAVKLGARGALVWDKLQGQPVLVPAVPTRAIDPTGAGDAFCGGFLAGLAGTGDPVRAACCGAVSASAIVSRFGVDGALPVDRSLCRERAADHEARLSRPLAPAPQAG